MSSTTQHIDIAALIETRGLDAARVASHLYPTHKHPAVALGRLISGESTLTWDHVCKLSEISGIPLSDMRNEGWRMRSRGQLHTLTNGDYTAELDTTVWTTRLSVAGTVLQETIIHDRQIALSAYLAVLDEAVAKFRSNDA